MEDLHLLIDWTNRQTGRAFTLQHDAAPDGEHGTPSEWRVTLTTPEHVWETLASDSALGALHNAANRVQPGTCFYCGKACEELCANQRCTTCHYKWCGR